jgi:hypothetical protein
VKQLKQLLSIKSILALVALAVALWGSSALALAQAGARVYPQQIELSNNTLAVDVVAENVTSMYGAEFRVKYDPSVLRVQDAAADKDGIQIQPGSLLPADQGFVVANKVDEAEGTIVFALTLLRPAEPVTGSGPLARITFEMLQDRPSSIDVEHAKLVAINPAEPGKMPETIPSEVAALAVGNNGSNELSNDADESSPAARPDTPAGTADGEFPWWIVAVIVLTLGLLVLGGFVVLGVMNKMEVTQPGTPQTREQLPGRPTGRRPSALNPKTPAELTQRSRQSHR